MREQIFQFGEKGRLTGVFTEATDRGVTRPAVLFLNAGIVHRIGPNRLHVKLARAFAASGVSCMRFDLSGLGESLPGPSGIGYEQQSIDDTRSAIDFAVKRSGERPIILAGICSGADNSYRTALVDERVQGLILLDPYAYQNTTAKISDLAQRAQDPGRWKRLVEKIASGSSSQNDEEEIYEDDNDRIAPPREEFGADLERLSKRGVQIFIRYTASVSHLINDKSQFAKSFKEFDFGDKLSIDVLPSIDHIYTELSAQKELEDRLIGWIEAINFCE